MTTRFCTFSSFRFDPRAYPSCFQTDPLSALLTKYVPAEQRPQRDVVGEYAGRDVHEMVVSCLRKVPRVFSIRALSSTSIPQILSRWLHLPHAHSHYSPVSRICTHSFIILLSLSLLYSVRPSSPQFLSGWWFSSVLYLPSVARYPSM